MNQRLYLCIFFFVSILSKNQNSFSQTFELENQLIFGGSKTDQVVDIYKIPNSKNYIVVGISNSTNGDLNTLNTTNDYGVIIIRVDSALNLIWKKFIPDFNTSSTVVSKNSNSISIFCQKKSNNNSTILDIDINNGNILNSIYTPSIDELGLRTLEGPILIYDNGVLIAGQTYNSYNSSFNQRDIILHAYNNSNSLIWNKRLLGSYDEVLFKAYAKNDKAYFWINSNSYNYDFTNLKINTSQKRQKDLWLFELDTQTGNLIKKRQIGNNWHDEIIDTEISEDGFYVLLTIGGFGGDFYVRTKDSYSNVICKIDFDGNILWQKNTGSTSYSTLEIQKNSDLLVLSTYAIRRFTKDGNFLFYENNYPLIYPSSSSPIYTISENFNRTIFTYTKDIYSGNYSGKTIYLSTLKRKPKPIELKNISKTWVCLNENIQVKIDTTGIFSASNIFKYGLKDNYGNFNAIGESTTTDFNFALSEINSRTTNVAIDYSLIIESTEPYYKFELNNLKVQAPFSDYSQNLNALPNQIQRGEVVNLNFYYYKNYHSFPTNITINGEKIGFMGEYLSFGFTNSIYGDSAVFYIEKVEDLCGVHELNQKKVIKVVDTYPKLTDQLTLGGTEDDIIRDMKVDLNKNIFLAGVSSSKDYDIENPKGGADIFIVKLDSIGNVIFKKNYGGTNNDYINKIFIKPNGNIVFVGKSFSNAFNGIAFPDISETGLLGELSNNGDLLWVKKFGYVRPDIGRFYNEEIKDLVVDNLGNIFTCGYYDNYYGVRKHNSIGDIIWQQKFGSTDNTVKSASAITIDSERNVYVCGSTTLVNPDFRGGGLDCFLTKFSENGNLLKSRHLGGSGSDQSFSILLQNDELYISGITESGDIDFPNDGFKGGQYFLYKTNLNFDSVWVKTYKQSYFAGFNSLSKGKDDSVLMTASFNQSSAYYKDSTKSFPVDNSFYVLNINSNGDNIWIKSIGGPVYVHSGNAIYVKDSSYLFATTVGTNSFEITSEGDLRNKIGKTDFWIGFMGGKKNCKNSYTQVFPSLVSEQVNVKTKIKLSNSFRPGDNFKFQAAQNIELLPGTQFDKGVNMELKIGNCPNP